MSFEVVEQQPSVVSNLLQKEAMSHMVDYQKVRSIAEAEKLTMRIWVLNSLLDTEETYLQYLNTLLLVSCEACCAESKANVVGFHPKLF